MILPLPLIAFLSITLSIYAVLYFYHKYNDIFHPFVFLSGLLSLKWVVLALPALPLVGSDGVLTPYFTFDIFASYLLIPIVFLVALFLASKTRVQLPALSRTPAFFLSPILFTVLVASLVFLVVFSLYIYVRSVGGMSVILEFIDKRNQISSQTAVNPFAFYLFQLIVVLPYIIYLLRSQLPSLFLRIIPIIALLPVILGGRSRSAVAIFLIFISYHYSKKQITLKRIMFVLPAIIFTLTLLGLIRGLFLPLLSGLTLSPADLYSSLLNSLSSISYIKPYSVAAHSIQDFLSYWTFIPGIFAGLQPFFDYIPIQSRDTILSSGQVIGLLVFGETGRSSYPLPFFAELYFSFTVLGLFIVSYLWALSLKLLYIANPFVNSQTSVVHPLLYPYLFFFLTYTLFNGGFTAIFESQNIFVFSSVILLSLLISPRRIRF